MALVQAEGLGTCSLVPSARIGVFNIQLVAIMPSHRSLSTLQAQRDAPSEVQTDEETTVTQAAGWEVVA